MKVIWTPEAKESFDLNVDFLLRDWGVQVTSEFMDRLDDVILKIQSNPQLYPAIAKDIHRCVVVKQISLYYRIVSLQQVDLLVFWNNFKDPETLKFLS
jgi:plasmid stabilization system protein ParE